MYFYQIKCCFYTQNGCMNKQILQRLIHEKWCDTYFDAIEEWRQRYGNGHLEIRKMKIKEANLFNTVGCCI